jgi:cathepsin A (carboxypeptidase C)
MIYKIAILALMGFQICAGSRTWQSKHHGSTEGSLTEKTTTEDGLCDANVKQHSGYFHVKSGVDKNYFYWFFESRSSPSTDPLVIWLTGGPGCSSQLALMTENGPCTPSADGQTTVNNPFSWNTNSNIMWIDQPADVGFSYGQGISDVDHGEEEVGEDMYNFLQEFFTAHGEYLPNEFYVFGESYGGHYVPAISSRIFDGNNNKEGLHINLAGLGIGNGLTDPVIQYQYYAEMAMNNSYGIKCVTEDQYDSMVKHIPTCRDLAIACQANTSYCEVADEYCNIRETTPYYGSGLNPYDIRKPCGENPLCYDFTSTETFLNLPSTREALGVSDKVKTWEECNTAVNAAFISDWMKNFNTNLIPMLEGGVRALIYAGDVDFICNWIGNKAWTKELQWTGQDSYDAAPDQDWIYTETNGEPRTGGKVKSATAKEGQGSLTFLQVYEAGHMVPMDQPKAALDLLNTFIFNKKFA